MNTILILCNLFVLVKPTSLGSGTAQSTIVLLCRNRLLRHQNLLQVIYLSKVIEIMKVIKKFSFFCNKFLNLYLEPPRPDARIGATVAIVCSSIGLLIFLVALGLLYKRRRSSMQGILLLRFVDPPPLKCYVLFE